MALLCVTLWVFFFFAFGKEHIASWHAFHSKQRINTNLRAHLWLSAASLISTRRRCLLLLNNINKKSQHPPCPTPHHAATIYTESLTAAMSASRDHVPPLMLRAMYAEKERGKGAEYGARNTGGEFGARNNNAAQKSFLLMYVKGSQNQLHCSESIPISRMISFHRFYLNGRTLIQVFLYNFLSSVYLTRKLLGSIPNALLFTRHALCIGCSVPVINPAGPFRHRNGRFNQRNGSILRPVRFDERIEFDGLYRIGDSELWYGRNIPNCRDKSSKTYRNTGDSFHE